MVKPACRIASRQAVGRLVYTHDLPAGIYAYSSAGRLKIINIVYINFMYCVYAIKSIKSNYIYVGISDNFDRRINQHNKGYNRTTKPYIPFKTILIEELSSRVEARKREKFLKSGCGKEFIKNLIARH